MSKMLGQIAAVGFIVALGGCVVAENDGRQGPEPVGEAEGALTGWQCASCTGNEYVYAVSLPQGTTLGCASGVAYRCETIPWCTRASFAHCGATSICPPGWQASALASGPSYCGGIEVRTSCTAVPHPTGTYSTCDAACYPAFTQTSVSSSVPSCDYGDKRTCTL